MSTVDRYPVAVRTRGRAYALQTTAPRVFFVCDDGLVVPAFPPHFAELDEKHPITSVEQSIKLIDCNPRLLTRRERRAAVRALGMEWPVGGSAPTRLPPRT